MNLKKFISENIVDIGADKENEEKDANEAPAHKVQPPAPAPHRDPSTPKSFINKQNEQNDVSQVYSNPSPDTINNSVVSPDALTDARNRISKAIADSNQPGTDYHEFILTKNAMSSIPVEGERYKVAFAGLSATGLTKEILDSSAGFYMKVVDNELNSFLAQFSQVFKTEVLDKKDTIASKQKQMVQLSDQINKLNDEIKKMNDDVQHNETAFVMKKNSFQQAAAEAKSNIQNELDKIDQYIAN